MLKPTTYGILAYNQGCKFVMELVHEFRSSEMHDNEYSGTKPNVPDDRPSLKVRQFRVPEIEHRPAAESAEHSARPPRTESK